MTLTKTTQGHSKTTDEVVITRFTNVETALFVFAEKGVASTCLKIIFAKGKVQEQKATLLLELLRSAFGWRVSSREVDTRILQGVDRTTGAPVSYRVDVNIVTVEKDGAIRTGEEKDMGR